MSLFNFSTPQQSQQQQKQEAPAAPPDIEVQQPPSDSISSLRWSPTAEVLAVGSWDNQVSKEERHSH